MDLQPTDSAGQPKVEVEAQYVSKAVVKRDFVPRTLSDAGSHPPAARVNADDWRYTALVTRDGARVAAQLSRLGRRPEDLVVLYDRAAVVFHIWYTGRDKQTRYVYNESFSAELSAAVPPFNYFKQDDVTVPAGIAGDSGNPVPVFFTVSGTR